MRNLGQNWLRLIPAAALAGFAALSVAAPVSSSLAAEAAAGQIYIHTEIYPRPPYSGATYYIYERYGKVICTKLTVCNKFNDCEATYKQGSWRDEEDIQTGEPYDRTPKVAIPAASLGKHVCLTKFHLD